MTRILPLIALLILSAACTAATPRASDVTTDQAVEIAVRQGLLAKLAAEPAVAFGTLPAEFLVEYEAADEKRQLPEGLAREKRQQHLERFYARRGDQVSRRLHASDAQVIRRWDSIPLLTVEIHTRNALLKVLRDHQVISVMRADEKAEPQLIEAKPMAYHSQAIAAGGTGAGITIAVLDTGISSTNALRTSGRIRTALDFTGSGTPWDAHGHGTKMITTAAQTAPGARFISLKVGGRSKTDGSFSVVAITAAMNWLIRNAASYPDLKVANMSFSMPLLYAYGDCNTTLTRLASELIELDILPIAASGNKAQKSRLPEPACGADVLSVGAVYDYNGSSLGFMSCTDKPVVKRTPACFSNSSPALDVLAPGCNIITAGAGGHICGTSVAAALTSGLVAIARGAPASYEMPARLILDAARAQPLNLVRDPRSGLYRPLTDAYYLTSRVKAYRPPSSTGSTGGSTTPPKTYDKTKPPLTGGDPKCRIGCGK